ncbi:MAG: hypothetical protein MPJ24_06360 [Pirellulaceae bacterium]|nr:hypothetical protein [Pirellulaceae bacterium]
MRPLLALITSILSIGLVYGYLEFAKRNRPSAGIEVDYAAKGEFKIDLTVTCPLEPDPFALDLEEDKALTLSFEGREIFKGTDLPQGEPVNIENFGQLQAGRIVTMNGKQVEQVGKNEFFVKVAIPFAYQNKAQAVRIRITQDGLTLVEKTLWSNAQGTAIEGIVIAELPAIVTPSPSNNLHEY